MQRFVSIAIFCAGLMPVHASAQWVPKAPIRIVVPFAAGGPTDKVARDLATSRKS